jgi:hypothetical protein
MLMRMMLLRGTDDSGHELAAVADRGQQRRRVAGEVQHHVTSAGMGLADHRRDVAGASRTC